MNTNNPEYLKAAMGDLEARTRIINVFHAKLCQLASALLKREHQPSIETNDLVGEWYPRFKWSPEIRKESDFMKFSYVTMKHILIDRARKRKVKHGKEVGDENLKFMKAPGTGRSFRIKFSQLLSSLPTQDRQIVVLRLVEQKSLPEISTQLNLTINVVTKRWSVLKSELHQFFKTTRATTTYT